jgi:Proteins of 100 residues with WXG
MENFNFEKHLRDKLEMGLESNLEMPKSKGNSKHQGQLDENLNTLLMRFKTVQNDWNDAVQQRFYQEFTPQFQQIIKDFCQELDDIDNTMQRVQKHLDA